MTEVRTVDLDDRVAWVQPGVLNLDLDRRLAPAGVRFSPDPSSQQACTIGGNVANNSGGPHCLAEGVTSAHVLAVEVVTAEGEVAVLGGVDAEPAGLDLRGLVVGSEGTLGIVTAVAVRLTSVPPSVATLLAAFDDMDAAADAVSAVIAAGEVPAALEMIDGPLAAVLEDYVRAGFPRDAAAVLLVEVEGSPAAAAAQADRVATVLAASGATSVVPAADDEQRAAWWKGRKSAFGAIARIRPDYALHDTVVPRTRLAEVLREVRAIVDDEGLEVYNVFHAGDGNLHPLVVFDAREEGVAERVQRCGRRVVEVSLAAGGVLTGEHGIGMDKRDYMGLQFDEASLAAQSRVRAAVDPAGRMNPDKVLPAGARCGDVAGIPEGVWI
jgi:glycolate oxidase